jgi:UDP-N-acetylmuramate dehydrogenase
MILEKDVPLSTLTTLRVGGTAQYVAHAKTVEDIKEAIAFATLNKLPWYVLGEGSNVLAPDAGYPGVIIRIELSDSIILQEQGESVLVLASAGVSWDVLVAEVSKRGLWGIENLAGIPGTVGAAPIQNIGAYGSECADMFLSVEVYDTKTGEERTLKREECLFGYRESRFKREKHLIITKVAFLLSKKKMPKLSYPDVQKAIFEGKEVGTPEAIANTIRAIRSKKFPDIRVEGTAGSFFKNPFLSQDAYDLLKKEYPELPGYVQENGTVKIPLAFILDRVLNLKGYSEGHVRLFEAQPLVLVASAGATAQDIERFADNIALRVQTKNIFIEREVQSINKNFS